jgi:hypothetical protein
VARVKTKKALPPAPLGVAHHLSRSTAGQTPL